MEYIRVEKRLPYGFRGEWGNVYKLYTYDKTITANGVTTVIYQDNNYLKVRGECQFKYPEENKTTETAQPVTNLVGKGVTQMVETTDAYFDNEERVYKCVADIGDLIELNGWWVVDKVEEMSIYTPNKQTFYRLLLKKINEKITIKEY